MITCKFQIFSKRDRKTGIEWKKQMAQDCGEPGVWYRLYDDLTCTDMPLCWEHANLILNNYHWKIQNIDKKEDENDQQSIQTGGS